MTDKPDLTKVWAENADPTDIKNPDTDEAGKFQKGWLTEVPPHTWFNYIQNNFSAALSHFNEYGIAQWDTDTVYPVGAWARSIVDGEVYKALSAQSGNEPSASPSSWDRVVDVQTSSTDSTAGRLMAVGAFGLGSTSVPSVSNLDNIDRAGFYLYNPPVVGAPNDAGGSLLHINRNGTIAAAQQAFDQTTGRVYTRILKASVWQPWAEVRDSVNTSNPNLLVNGAFQVYQEANAINNPTSANEYGSADMMRCRRNGNATGITAGKSTSGLEAGMEHAYTIARSVGDTNTDLILLCTQLETKDVIPLQGKTMTVSVRLRLGGNFSATQLSLKVNSGTGIDEQAGIAGGSFPTGSELLVNNVLPISQKLIYFTTSFTFTVPSNAKGLSVSMSWGGVGTAVTEDNIRFNYIKLEEGSVATPMVRPSYAEELAKCQRYYQQSYRAGTAAGSITDIGAIQWAENTNFDAKFTQRYSTTLRGPATVTVYNPVTGTTGEVHATGAGADNRAVTVIDSTEEQHALNLVAVPSSTGNQIKFHYTADARL